MATNKLIHSLWASAVLAGCAASAYAEEPVPPREDRTAECGDLFNSTGPWDYRIRTPAREYDFRDTKRNHYDPAVDRMRAGEYTQRVMHDIDFLLRVFPNHYMALQLVQEYERGGGKRFAYRAVDCYFDRARRFAPDDVNVVIMEGSYFSKRKDLKRARESYEDALLMAPDSTDVNYNVGLFYAQVGEYDKALACAKLAYGRGYPLPGLKTKLEKAGYTIKLDEEPAPAAAPAAEPASPAPAKSGS
jgi:tetratricopeptide (TPR) repeat protein